MVTEERGSRLRIWPNGRKRDFNPPVVDAAHSRSVGVCALGGWAWCRKSYPMVILMVDGEPICPSRRHNAGPSRRARDDDDLSEALI